MRIAFEYLEGWLGGLNYLKNILAALRCAPENGVTPVMLLTPDSGQRRIPEFEEYGCEWRTRPGASYYRWNADWWKLQCMRLVRTKDQMLARRIDRFCANEGIDVVFHAGGNVYEAAVPQLAWIADFQHIHLPDMFSAEEIEYREHSFSRSAQFASGVILNSKDAQKDFVASLPRHADKAKVLPFVAHVPESLFTRDLTALRQKYHLPEKFFYLPNQFWRHKNHETVFRAVSVLKNKGVPVTVVCTGQPFDYRNHKFGADLLQSLSLLDIRDCVAVLGVTPQEDVYALMRQSVAVINPSRFEGWSTSVEECKSLGKRVILSDLAVHREQAPPAALYFDPSNVGQLADALEETWAHASPGPDFGLEEQSRSDLVARQRAFASGFAEICSKSGPKPNSKTSIPAAANSSGLGRS